MTDNIVEPMDGKNIPNYLEGDVFVGFNICLTLIRCLLIALINMVSIAIIIHHDRGN